MNTTTATTTTKRSGRIAVAAITLVIASLFTTFLAPQAGAATAPKVVLNNQQVAAKNALNADRKANGLKLLTTQADAQAKAQAWANKLAAEGTIYHSTLTDGISTRWCSLGENVGYGPNVKTIETAYMNSPKHRANIVNTKWNGVGVGVAVKGNLVYTVQVFIKTC